MASTLGHFFQSHYRIRPEVKLNTLQLTGNPKTKTKTIKKMTYSNDKNQKTPNVSQISKTHNTVSCAAKYDPKGGETRILVLTVRMKIESCFLFGTDKEKTN